MPQNRILYNVQDLYVGPARDDQALILPNQHLLQRIYRVQSFGYNINLNREEYKELGSLGVVGSPLVKHPDVTFEFEYLQAGIPNEIKVGLNANWNYTGSPAIYSNNFGVSLISGFADVKRLDDKRNFYVAINQSGQDSHATYVADFATGYSGFSLETFVDPLSPRYHLMSFVNSYLTNISYSAEVGNFPSARMSYLADDIVYYPSGSGVPVPKTSFDKRSGVFSSFRAVLPKHYNDGLPSALRPGDAVVSITSTGYGAAIQDWGLSLSDAKIQSYNINVSIPREKLEYLGSYSPMDRPIVYPVYVDVSVDFVVGDLLSSQNSFITGYVTGYTTGYVSGYVTGYASGFEDSALRSSDNNWYLFRLVKEEGIYYLDLDQSSSSQPAGASANWVLNYSGFNYNVELGTNAGETSFLVGQNTTGTAGYSYKPVWATDNTLHKVTVYSGESFVTLEINQTGESIPTGISGYISGYLSGYISGYSQLTSGRIESLDSLTRKDYEYDISISIANSLPRPLAGQNTAILFNLKRCKIESLQYNSSISRSKTATLNFRTELNPHDLSKGLFISGIIPSLIVGGTPNENGIIVVPPTGAATGITENIIYIRNELITDGGEVIITDDGDPIAVDDVFYTPIVF